MVRSFNIHSKAYFISALGTIAPYEAKKASSKKLKAFNNRGTPGEIRTPDLWIRSPALYPAELRAHKESI